MQFELHIHLSPTSPGIADNTAMRHTLEALAIEVGERYFDLHQNVIPHACGIVRDEDGCAVGSWRMSNLERQA